MPAPPPRDRGRGALGAGRRILVVDDEYEMRYLTRAFLEDAFPGLEVIDAVDGPEGLALLARRPDLVVSDYRMPGMDGFEFLLRAMDTIPPSRCVLMTAYMDQALRDRARDAGMRSIDKGGDPHNIVGVVGEILRALGPAPRR